MCCRDLVGSETVVKTASIRYIPKRFIARGQSRVFGLRGRLLLPTASGAADSWYCPARIRTWISPRVKASVLPLDDGATSTKPICGPFLYLCGAGERPYSFPRPMPLGQRGRGSNFFSHRTLHMPDHIHVYNAVNRISSQKALWCEIPRVDGCGVIM